jgi:hypothetical protein
MNEAREVFWADYYDQLSQRAEPWLDDSNARGVRTRTPSHVKSHTSCDELPSHTLLLS